MSRQSGDGRGRLGGRAKGTPNKNNPLKEYLRSHSAAYFEPNLVLSEQLLQSFLPPGSTPDDTDIPVDAIAARLGVNIGDKVSRFDIDCLLLSAADRVDAEIKLLNFHTPKMQAATIDMTIDNEALALDERLARLALGGNPD